jgi:hypothetical protein
VIAAIAHRAASGPLKGGRFQTNTGSAATATIATRGTPTGASTLGDDDRLRRPAARRAQPNNSHMAR